MIVFSIYSSELMESLLDNVPIDCVVELRLDALDFINWDLLSMLLQKRPLLLTFRSQKEGGSSHPEEKRREALKKAIMLRPPYLDLEYDRDLSWIKEYQNHLSKTQVILSYHCLDSLSQEEIEQKLSAMKKVSAWKYKIAAEHTSTIEAMQMLKLMKKHSDFIGISLGEKGYLTRLLNPIYLQRITYTSLDVKTRKKLGQISYEELMNLYHYPTLNPQTKIYGLVGSSLSKSPGVKVYNNLFYQKKINAIYLNFELTEKEFIPFLLNAQELAFSGLSVTAPFKKEAAGYLREKGDFKTELSINTLLFKDHKLFGKNTDGIAALQLLKRVTLLKGKKIMLLGAGGVSEAIAFSLAKENVRLIFVNRTEDKAKELAQRYKGDYRSLENLSSLKEKDYDILIYAASQKEIAFENIIFNNKIILDVSHDDKDLQGIALQKNCIFIGGKEFWLEQGASQQQWWHPEHEKGLKETMKAALYD